MSDLTDADREALRLAVWPVEADPDPGRRRLYADVEAAVKGIVAARERAAAAQAWDEAVQSAYDHGWLHEPAYRDMLARNPALDAAPSQPEQEGQP